MLIPIDLSARTLERRLRTNLAALAPFAELPVKAIGAGAHPPPRLLAHSGAPEVAVNVQLGDAVYFPGDARETARAHAAAFAAANQAFVPGVVAYGPDDEIAFERVRALDRALGLPLMADPKPYSVPPRYAPILSIFGIGLGWQIEELLQRFDVLHLVIYEAELALFHASLYVIDWAQVARRFAAPGRRLTIVVESDAAKGTNGVLAGLYHPCRALAVGSRYFRTYQSATMDAVTSEIARLVPFLGYGWGYFKDERRQVLHTLENIHQPHLWLTRRWPALPQADAVIVGSGPSLERTLPLIQAIRRNVIVFSAGSAIRPLVRAGVEPDFHIELETAPITADFLLELSDPSLFERITFVASNGMAPAALAVFRNIRLFVRDNSLSSQLLGDCADAIPGCYPIVGNAAVAVAAALGFRRITLFGLDFGYRDPRRHHAAGTVYMDEASGEARTDLAGVGLGHVPLLDYNDTRHQLVSTRGDALRADDVLRMSHAMMESFLVGVPGLWLRQCGEGAALFGADNLTPERFDASIYVGDRTAMLEAIGNRFEAPPVDAAEYTRRMTQLIIAFFDLARRLRRQFKRSSMDTAAYARLIGQAWESLAEMQRRNPALGSLVNGVFTSYFKATIERSFMTGSAAEQRRFLALAQEHFLALLEDLSAAVESLPVDRGAVRSSLSRSPPKPSSIGRAGRQR